MDWKQYITTDPSILHGAACFAGTRVPVTVVLDNLADGAEPAEIVRQYRWPAGGTRRRRAGLCS
jgi:uncharacterized protein (DUF433 family)